LLKLAKNRNEWRDDVNTALKLWVLYKTGNFWTDYDLLAFQKDPA